MQEYELLSVGDILLGTRIPSEITNAAQSATHKCNAKDYIWMWGHHILCLEMQVVSSAGSLPGTINNRPRVLPNHYETDAFFLY